MKQDHLECIRSFQWHSGLFLFIVGHSWYIIFLHLVTPDRCTEGHGFDSRQRLGFFSLSHACNNPTTPSESIAACFLLNEHTFGFHHMIRSKTLEMKGNKRSKACLFCSNNIIK